METVQYVFLTLLEVVVLGVAINFIVSNSDKSNTVMNNWGNKINNVSGFSEELALYNGETVDRATAMTLVQKYEGTPGLAIKIIIALDNSVSECKTWSDYCSDRTTYHNYAWPSAYYLEYRAANETSAEEIFNISEVY